MVSTPSRARRVVLSGAQPSGTLHLGNYFGALRQHVARSQNAAASGDDAFFFIVNYHALTSLKDAAALRRLGEPALPGRGVGGAHRAVSCTAPTRAAVIVSTSASVAT